MAEFKLGRIKFVYQGEWSNSASYVVDDVVSIGGKTYICVQTHEASNLFAADLAPPTKWNLAADGSEWTGAWQEEQYYNTGALVKWGGIVYICTEAHTSADYQTP